MSNVLQNNLHSDPAIQRRSMSKENIHEDLCVDYVPPLLPLTLILLAGKPSILNKD